MSKRMTKKQVWNKIRDLVKESGGSFRFLPVYNTKYNRWFFKIKTNKGEFIPETPTQNFVVSVFIRHAMTHGKSKIV